MKSPKIHNLLLFAILIIFFLQLVGLVFLFVFSTRVASAQEKGIITKVKDVITGDNVTFTPQATIPGSDVFINYEDCKKKKCNDKKEEECRQLCSISLGKYGEGRRGLLIAEYIQAWYKFAVAAVGILAVVMIMGGGLIWLTAGGKANQVSTAKDWIMGAVVGLILALMSYTLLDILNPNLVTFESLAIDEIVFVPTSDICCFPKNGPQPASSNEGCVIKDNKGNEETGVNCDIMQACIQTLENELYHCENIIKGESTCMSEKDCPQGWFCVENICYNGMFEDPCNMRVPSCSDGLYCSEGIKIGGTTKRGTFCYEGKGGDPCSMDVTEQCDSPAKCKDNKCCFSTGASCSGCLSGNNECCSGDCVCSGEWCTGTCTCK